MKRILCATIIVAAATVMPARADTIAHCGGFAPRDVTCAASFTMPKGGLLSLFLPAGELDVTISTATGSEQLRCSSGPGFISCSFGFTGHFAPGQAAMLFGSLLPAANVAIAGVGSWSVDMTDGSEPPPPPSCLPISSAKGIVAPPLPCVVAGGART